MFITSRALLQRYNPGQKIANKFTKLSKIGFCMEFFTAERLHVFNEYVKVWLLGVGLVTTQPTQRRRKDVLKTS